MKIAYLTAGAAGMYCGSCMLDNALARAMIAKGHECLLIPLYTPIRTDEENVSIDRVFMGGVNVFLQQKLPWLSYLPRWMDSFLNQPWLIKKLTANTGKTSTELLGRLSVSMLRGMKGNQRKEFSRLQNWLKSDVQPDHLLLTNLLIGGCIPELKQSLNCKVHVLLQGDDIFLDSIPNRYRTESIQSMQRLVPFVDTFLVHSQAYGDHMSQLLDIPLEKIQIIPLGIDTRDFDKISFSENSKSKDTFSIGYLARMSPEKGLDALVDAFIRMKKDAKHPSIRLKLAGWLGPQHQEFWEAQKRKLREAGLDEQWEYFGSVDRKSKIDFLSQIDLLCVPTSYHEPKGLFVLEAVAAGVPYVQPAHGAFPEIHARLESGQLFDPADRNSLVKSLEAAIEERRSLGSDPETFLELKKEVGIDRMADRVLAVLDNK